MESISANTLSVKQSNIPNIILSAGLLAGVMDIIAACIHAGFRGVSPLGVFHFIAGGLLGLENASQGGYKTAALGLFLHFFIAISAATVYYLASRKLNFLINQAIICGALYGIAVYSFMRFVVTPLSALGTGTRPSPPPRVVIISMLIHMTCVGLPIALMIKRKST